jgi:hypothetical protein
MNTDPKELAELIWNKMVLPTAVKVYIYLREHPRQMIPCRELKAIAFPDRKSFERQSKPHEDWPPYVCINDAHRRLMKAKTSDAIDEFIELAFELSIQVLSREKNRDTFDAWLDLKVIPQEIKKAMKQRNFQECRDWFKVLSQLPKHQQKMIEGKANEKGEAGQKVNETKELASIEVEIARVIWDDEYEGHWKRAKENGPSAEEIVANRYHGLTVDQLKRHREKYGRPKPLRRNRT